MCLDRGGDAEAASQATPEPSNLLVPLMNIASVRDECSSERGSDGC